MTDFSRKSQTKLLNKSKNKKPPLYFYLALIGIPVIFFILLESGLRIFSYGYNNEQWIEVSEGKLILNPEIARRYFHKTQSLPYSNQEVFDAVKQKNNFRIFVMGESSAAGFPFAPLGSFSRYLQKRLELVYPESKIEVVNLGITAVNSYTIRDLSPGVLEMSPDLIIIYTGHNEYYGALGVGSMESFGTSRNIINLGLWLNRFKTFGFLTDIIRTFSEWVSPPNSEDRDATLMERMVSKQQIAFESELYKEGIGQFKNNMHEILELAKEKNVKVILSTLTCNTLDQQPFISLKTENYPPAKEIFEKAKQELLNGKISTADSLFTYAKELDALRFRAPEAINNIIREYSLEFNFPLANIDSVFRSKSPYGIVGDNLMTDHLHPTLEGYQLIGKIFFESMKSIGILPDTEPIILTDEQQDSLTKANFIFSKLDSIQAAYRITALKNKWPFIKDNQSIPVIELLKPANYIDSLIYNGTVGDLDWEKLHRKAAEWYLKHGELENYKEQMDILISQFPFVIDYYNSTSYEFLKIGRYDIAYSYLEKGFLLKPDAFSSKWLGIIDLSKGNNESAVKFLAKSLSFDPKDSQVLFNLAGAYSRLELYDKSLAIINSCLQIDSAFPGAANLKSQVERIINQKK
jgi:tetratricopeptide (TPR) repeat protein